ncbi:MAG: polysaccharide deacetylase family protein [Candidatus Latescibacterota bacterium]
MTEQILFNLQVDCEATQRSIGDAALGERAIRGVAEVCAAQSLPATFVVIPGDMQVHAPIYRELEAHGHEVGLHVHPAEQGYEEFLGVYGPGQQVSILRQAMDAFAQGMGRSPECFTPGYFSANDHTFPVLEFLGLRHGLVSCPTRNLPQCACVWGSSPLDAHYPHRHNRCLSGDVDFVDVPVTVDPESRLWGGAHPQDLRVELVDAKNHYYTIEKAVKRQLAAAGELPVKYLKALTHNLFEYGDERDFRRQTLLGIIAAARRVCERLQAAFVPATTAQIAAAYRARVPLPSGGQALELDTRGRSVRGPGA